MTKFTSDDYGEGYWERAEGSNYRNYGDDPGWEQILNTMDDSRFGRTLRIIEVACAKGYFVRAAINRGHDAQGFDLSEYAISKSVAPGATFVQDATKVPWGFDYNAADIVCGWEFLEHIREEDSGLVLSEAIACLRPGGELWFKTGIVVPGDHDFAGQEDHDHTHVNMQTREYWEYQFSTYGLQHRPEWEDALDARFAKRDWKGRFFVWRKP